MVVRGLLEKLYALEETRKSLGPGLSTYSNDNIGHISFSCKDLKEEMSIKMGQSASRRSPSLPGHQASVVKCGYRFLHMEASWTLTSAYSKLNS